MIGGVYSAKMLKHTKEAPKNVNELNWEDDNQRGNFRLPEDGSIFIDGLPFHHYSLKELKEKHFECLRQNGWFFKLLNLF